MDFCKCLENFYSKKEIERLLEVEVLVFGCGGLGSNLVNSLVRSGVRKFTLVDFDKIEPSNLNRQLFNYEDIGLLKVDALEKNMLKINKDLIFKKDVKKINSENLKDYLGYKIICECFDNANLKQEVFDFFYNKENKVYQASGMGFDKNEEDFNFKLKTIKNIKIVGDFKNDIKDFPPLCPRVNIVSNLQAELVLKDILNGKY